MKIELTFRNTTKQTSFTKTFFNTVVETTLRETKIKAQTVNVSITLVGDNRIKVLNKKHRNKDKPTDVLSFPIHKSLFSVGKLQPYTLKPIPYTLKHAILDIGDIFISIPTAKRYAKRDNMILKHKLQFLAVHGILHLLGFDHERSKQEEKKMFQLQNKVLQSLM